MENRSTSEKQHSQGNQSAPKTPEDKRRRVTLKEYRETAEAMGYSGVRKGFIIFDMSLWRVFHHCFPKEYAYYRFDRLKPFYRKEYLLRFDQYITYAKVNLSTGMTTKMSQYERYSELICRDWMPVDTGNLDAVREFAKEHSKVLFKPENSSLGKGIFTYEPAVDTEEKLFQLMLMCSRYHYICEEYLVQHPLMASFHPKSVNSVRVLTFNDGKEIHIIAATLKMGLNDSEVDNLLNGGLCANIDLTTGIVNTPGISRDRDPQYFHPETGVKIIGTEIPLFDQVLDTARKGAALTPECAVLGWDIAVLPDRACIIEMNNRPGIKTIQGNDRMPRGKEIKAFARNSRDHIRKISRKEKEELKCYY